jgi:uncharacterized protein (DUF1015 family)
MQDAYYRLSPYNAVRITLNIEKRQDSQTSYPEAGATFQEWIRGNVLIQEPLPSMYAYYQEYRIEGQTRIQRGLVALLDLEKAGTGIIPHEHTLAAPKQDRLQLMRSLEGNEDFIYMLYSDEGLEVNRITDACVSGRQPDITVTDEYGAIHRVWAIAESGALARIQGAMRSHDLFIADGHHRFETSVNFMNECRGKGWKPAAVESFDKRMVACFNTSAGVTILPTHRLVRDLPDFDPEVFLRRIEDYFNVTQVSSPSSLWEEMNRRREENVFGFYGASRREFYLLCLRKEADIDRRLDVTILHSLLLEQFLGIDEGKLAAQTNLDYIRERELCIQLVNEGNYQAAFFLNPTTSEQMQRIASSGQRMPQKSTDFYPKLLTGLVFMKMRIIKN